MVIRIHGHHLLLGLRLNTYHKNHFGYTPAKQNPSRAKRNGKKTWGSLYNYEVLCGLPNSALIIYNI